MAGDISMGRKTPDYICKPIMVHYAKSRVIRTILSHETSEFKPYHQVPDVQFVVSYVAVVLYIQCIDTGRASGL